MNKKDDAALFVAKIKGSKITAAEFFYTLGQSRISDEDYKKIKAVKKLDDDTLVELFAQSNLRARDYLKILLDLGIINNTEDGKEKKIQVADVELETPADFVLPELTETEDENIEEINKKIPVSMADTSWFSVIPPRVCFFISGIFACVIFILSFALEGSPIPSEPPYIPPVNQSFENIEILRDFLTALPKNETVYTLPKGEFYINSRDISDNCFYSDGNTAIYLNKDELTKVFFEEADLGRELKISKSLFAPNSTPLKIGSDYVIIQKGNNITYRTFDDEMTTTSEFYSYGEPLFYNKNLLATISTTCDILPFNDLDKYYVSTKTETFGVFIIIKEPKIDGIEFAAEFNTRPYLIEILEYKNSNNVEKYLLTAEKTGADTSRVILFPFSDFSSPYIFDKEGVIFGADFYDDEFITINEKLRFETLKMPDFTKGVTREYNLQKSLIETESDIIFSNDNVFIAERNGNSISLRAYKLKPDIAIDNEIPERFSPLNAMDALSGGVIVPDSFRNLDDGYFIEIQGDNIALLLNKNGFLTPVDGKKFNEPQITRSDEIFADRKYIVTSTKINDGVSRVERFIIYDYSEQDGLYQVGKADYYDEDFDNPRVAVLYDETGNGKATAVFFGGEKIKTYEIS